jgi:hypothetical protein
MRSLTSGLVVFALLTVVAACQPVGREEQEMASRAPDSRAMTCAAWLQVSDGERLATADRIVGVSADLLERIRVGQHQPRGTARDVLIRDVVGSLSKNCEVIRPRDPSLGDLMDAMY